MAASPEMGKPRAVDGVTLTYPATTAYKQWVWREIRRRGWTLQKLVDEMKRIDRTLPKTISTSSLINLLGAEDAEPPPLPSNCSFMPALNRALGIAPPPVCNPTDELSQLVDRFRARWEEATPRERDALVALLGRREDDTSNMDGDRNGTGATPSRSRR